MSKTESTTKNIHPEDRDHFLEVMASDGWKLKRERKAGASLAMTFTRKI